MSAETLLFMIGEEMLSKVISLAADEISLAWNFDGELDKLKQSLEMVDNLIYDASSNNTILPQTIQGWLKELNDVAYEADTVLDEFAYQTLRCKVENRKRDKVLSLFSISKNPLLFRQKLAHKIRKVNVSIDEIYAKGTQIGLTQLVGRKDIIAATALHNKRLTHPFLEDEVVGRENDVLNIVNMLCGSDEESNLSVIAIVGLGGQGKTTLAQLVYKQEKVVRHFDERIWVCVSENFEVDRLLNEMVQSLTGKNPQLSNVEAIINKELGPKLKQRRFLLVLDDVWNDDEDKWGCFKSALSGICAARGSKIMSTTRSDKVASSMETSFNHHLNRLSDEESWTMFKKKAFAKGGPVETEDLAVIGREIVKRCKGLPLAIKVIGSLMYFKYSENDWLSVQNSQLWNSEDDTTRVRESLKLSYDCLPFPLKRCFSFCSSYPKDEVIKKSELIQSWMALGLLHPPAGRDQEMEDVGEKYFKTLLSSSLLQDTEKDEYEAIKSCKMHDIVHDLAIATAQTNYSNLKSQALFSEHFKSLLHLRVLVLNNYMMETLPDSIKELKHLRYLDISKTWILKLPHSLTKLYNLQILKLNRLIGVPKNFGNLINLRHLRIKDVSYSGDCMLIGIGRLTCLQTLPFFRVNRERGCHVKELGSLKNLRGDLTIFGLDHVENNEEAKHAFLNGKSHLCTLRLCWGTPMGFTSLLYSEKGPEGAAHAGDNDEYVLEGLEPHAKLKDLAIENFKGSKFPRWMMVENRASGVLGNLVKIELRNCSKCESVPPLGHLQHLKVVQIIGLTNVEAIGPEFYGKHTSNGGGDGASSSSGGVPIFPVLRELIVMDMTKLERWSEAVQQSSVSMNIVFPCLEKLHIEGCPSLKSFPSHFPSVIELRMSKFGNSLSLIEMSKTLTSLASLELKGCEGSKFEFVVEEFLTRNNRSLRRVHISCCHEFSRIPDNLVALEVLKLKKCDNLLDIQTCLPSVREVSIIKCGKLIGLPSLSQVFPVIEKLRIEDCNNMVAIPDMNSHTCLREVEIDGLGKLTSLPKLCESIRSLEVSECRGLTSLPEELGTSLVELTIQSCTTLVPRLDFKYLRRLILYYDCAESEELRLDHFPWPSSSRAYSNDDVVTVGEEEEDNIESDIQSLESLTLGGWAKLKSLPEQIQNLTALKILCLGNFEGVESLPDWLGNLSSLKGLDIWGFKKLKYFPSVEAMRRLTKLTELRFWDCPLLEERCTKGFRPEWTKISHIPYININCRKMTGRRHFSCYS